MAQKVVSINDSTDLETATAEFVAKLLQERSRIDRMLTVLQPEDEEDVNSSAGIAQSTIKRRKLSRAARKAIADAQRKRWARVRATSKRAVASNSTSQRPRRKLSRAARARMAAAQQARRAREHRGSTTTTSAKAA